MQRRFSAGSMLSTTVSIAAVLLLSTPFTASAAPSTGSSDSGSSDNGSSDSGSADSGSGGTGSSDGPNIDPNNYAQSCPDILMFAISGATDSDADRDPLNEEPRSPISNWVGNATLPLGEANRGNPGSVGWVYVPYPSTYGVDIISNVPTYQESVAAGVVSTNNLLDEYKTKCGDKSKFVLLGYSVGGEVAERVSMELGHRDPGALVTGDDIAGVVLVGDPYRPAGTPSLGEPGPARGGFQSQERKDYGTLNDKMTWACRPYDLACDAPDDIAALQLALGVLGQMRLTVLNPIQTVSDFGRAVASIATRAIIDIATQKDWLGSDETLLQVLLKVSDQSYQVDEAKARAALSPEQLLADLNWALGPGAEVVKAKLRAEAVGLVDDNKGIVDVLVEPYIFIGFLQHMLYWNNNPNDGREWESEKIVAWVSDLAQQEREKKALPPAPAASTDPAGAQEPAAPAVPVVEPAPQTLPAPGTVTRESDLGAFLESFGVELPPGVLPPQYSSVPEPSEAAPAPTVIAPQS